MPLTLSEAQGRINDLERELESVVGLLDSSRSRVKSMVANLSSARRLIDENPEMGKKKAIKIVGDVGRQSRDLQGALNGVIERCEIALGRSSQ